MLLYTDLVILPCCPGMHSWFAAAADARYSVVVPIIGVQVGLISLFIVCHFLQCGYMLLIN